ncbi:hypothetical protein [Hufsiella arboris]|nr:hypothetical protein [Hufsiella arboris]
MEISLTDKQQRVILIAGAAFLLSCFGFMIAFGDASNFSTIGF